jgi:hypothetical protein
MSSQTAVSGKKDDAKARFDKLLEEVSDDLKPAAEKLWKDINLKVPVANVLQTVNFVFVTMPKTLFPPDDALDPKTKEVWEGRLKAFGAAVKDLPLTDYLKGRAQQLAWLAKRGDEYSAVHTAAMEIGVDAMIAAKSKSQMATSEVLAYAICEAQVLAGCMLVFDKLDKRTSDEFFNHMEHWKQEDSCANTSLYLRK